MSLKTWLGGQIPRNLGKMVEDAKEFDVAAQMLAEGGR